MTVHLITGELHKGPRNGHLFEPGDIVELHSLEDNPQFNGEMVEISSYRQDGPYGKAYYIKSKNTDLMDILEWIYEEKMRKPENFWRSCDSFF